MGYEILITETAEADFDEVISYIAVSLGNPRAAGTLADDYESTLREISENPHSYHYFKDAEGNNTAYRRYNIRNFSLFFRLEGKRVIICRFLYAERDLYSVSMEIES